MQYHCNFYLLETSNPVASLTYWMECLLRFRRKNSSELTKQSSIYKVGLGTPIYNLRNPVGTHCKTNFEWVLCYEELARQTVPWKPYIHFLISTKVDSTGTFIEIGQITEWNENTKGPVDIIKHPRPLLKVKKLFHIQWFSENSCHNNLHLKKPRHPLSCYILATRCYR